MHPEIADVLAGRREWAVACGDALEVLPTLPAGCVDAVVTDPPYGLDLGEANDQREYGKHLARKCYDLFRDTYANFVDHVLPRLDAALKLAKRGAVFSGPHLQEQPKATAIGGIWHPAATGRTPWGSKNFLPILFYGNPPSRGGQHRPTVLRSTAQVEENGHPCPKPLEWMLWLVNKASLPGQLVLDPFAGSGTTGVACLQTGRRFIGVEISEEYAALARRRLEAAERSERETLFPAAGRDPAPEPSLFGEDQ